MFQLNVARLAAMIRQELDEAVAAGDAWAVRETDVMVMYGVGRVTVEFALDQLAAEGTIRQRDDRVWVPGAAA